MRPLSDVLHRNAVLQLFGFLGSFTVAHGSTQSKQCILPTNELAAEVWPVSFTGGGSLSNFFLFFYSSIPVFLFKYFFCDCCACICLCNSQFFLIVSNQVLVISFNLMLSPTQLQCSLFLTYIFNIFITYIFIHGKENRILSTKMKWIESIFWI